MVHLFLRLSSDLSSKADKTTATTGLPREKKSFLTPRPLSPRQLCRFDLEMDLSSIFNYCVATAGSQLNPTSLSQTYYSILFRQTLSTIHTFLLHNRYFYVMVKSTSVNVIYLLYYIPVSPATCEIEQCRKKSRLWITLSLSKWRVRVCNCHSSAVQDNVNVNTSCTIPGIEGQEPTQKVHTRISKGSL